MSFLNSLAQNEQLHKFLIGSVAVAFAFSKTDRFYYRNEKNLGMQCYNIACVMFGASCLASRIGQNALADFGYQAFSFLARPAIILAEGVLNKDAKGALFGAAALAAQFMAFPMYRVCKKALRDHFSSSRSFD